MLTASLAVPAGAGATTPYVQQPSPLQTPWTAQVSTVSPLPEYPRPQLQRRDWVCLNGRWQFEPAQPGQRPPFGQDLAQTILVPYPVQSPLSGVERPITAGWYRRTFELPARWTQEHVILNFGAVSWAALVYVNGRPAGSHRGDYDAFSLDITKLLHRGENELLVGYADPIGAAGEPVGKQVSGNPGGFYHTASSGIWQTVWLEPVAAEHISDLQLTPQPASDELIVSAAATGRGRQETVSAQALAGGRVVSTASGRPGQPFALPITRPHLWSPGDPYLYDLRVQLLYRNHVVDSVKSYFGMRSISLGRVDAFTRLLLNGRFLFQSGALAQGYWPDGLYTAPTDAALKFDLQAAKRLGFNMLREHVKVEPDRWYYWAARLGVLVWQDMPNMPVDAAAAPSAAARREFRHELEAIVRQHRSDPAIVAWVPFNEGWGQFDLERITAAIRQLDPSRPIDTQSGSANCCDAIESGRSDIRDSHLYFGPFAVRPDDRASAIGEYGGVLAFPPPGHIWPGTPTSIGSPALSWPQSWVAGVLRRQFAALSLDVRAGGLSAAVFTELGAYEQELGILSYDRRVYTMAPDLVRRLNEHLIASSRAIGDWAPSPAVPAGTSGLWSFDEGKGLLAADASANNHPLTLVGGAGWTSGYGGTALAVRVPGQLAVSLAPVIDTAHSFTVAAWLQSARRGQSGTAVSEAAAAGSAFSLGIETAGRTLQTRPGEIASGKPPPALRTWWTFLVPDGPGCPALSCGVTANMHYDDGRYSPAPGRWHYVVGVYDTDTQTISVYVDGAPEDVEHVDSLPPDVGPLVVGQGRLDYAPSDTFLGAIDELRTYARALSPDEAWALYQAERRQLVSEPSHPR